MELRLKSLGGDSADRTDPFAGELAQSGLQTLA
jgi:hypothetical protein